MFARCIVLTFLVDLSAYLFCQIVKQIWFESPAVILYISYLDEPLNRLFPLLPPILWNTVSPVPLFLDSREFSQETRIFYCQCVNINEHIVSGKG